MKDIKKKNKIRENDTEERDNVGVISKKILEKDGELVNARDTLSGREQRYEKKLLETIDDGKKSHPNQVFYIQIITRKPKVLQGTAVDNRFVVRLSCPTPTYHQTVFKYHPKADDIELLWTLPDLFICEMIRDNSLFIDPEIKESSSYVLDFYDGTLDKLCKKLNNEDVLEGNIILEVK